jgi:uncharacterized protein (DUF58 family)
MATTTSRLSYKRFFEGQLYQHNTVTLNHQRIYILPNKAGFAMLALILLMLVASINYNNSMGFVFTFLLASAVQVSTFYSYKNLSALEVKAVRSMPFHLGEKGSYNLAIKELEGRHRWSISIAASQVNYALGPISAQENKVAHVPVRPKNRGWHNVGTITLSSTFPLGLFRTWAPLQFEQPVLIYPTPLSAEHDIPMVSKQSPDGVSNGQAPGVDEFSGLRAYQQGEHYRHINWKAWAAEKGLYVNQFSEQQTPEIWLDWFQCPVKQAEAKLSQLCQWVIDAEKLGLHYGLRIPGHELPPSNGLEHQHSCLKILALYDA